MPKKPLSVGAKKSSASALCTLAAEDTARLLETKIVLQSTSSLSANPRNARTHSKRQIQQIARSIQRFGFISPIIIDADGMIIAGHGRWSAARQNGLKEVPVIMIDHLTDEEKRALAIAENKIALNAGWDRELLVAELAELSIILDEADVSLDIEITGFQTAEIDLILDDQGPAKPDPSDHVDLELPKVVVSRPGDIWQLGKHRVGCGDARSMDLAGSLLDGKQVNLVVTDPPYNVSVQDHVGGRGRIKHDEFAFASGELTPKQFRRFLRDALKVMLASAADGSLLYVFIDWRHVEDLASVGRKLDLELKNICVWNKTTPGQGSFYRSAHELVVLFAKPGAKSINNIELGRFGRNRTNVWTYPGVNTFKTGKGDDLAIHPTVKPTAMIADAIRDASKRGDIVLDPFLGSGTTLLACERTGRICHGVEYEPGYVDLAIRRWQELTGKDAVLCARDAVLLPENSDIHTSLIGVTFDELAALAAGSQNAPEGSDPEIDNASSVAPQGLANADPGDPSHSSGSSREDL
jgi:DNA modification methylase